MSKLFCKHFLPVVSMRCKMYYMQLEKPNIDPFVFQMLYWFSTIVICFAGRKLDQPSDSLKDCFIYFPAGLVDSSWKDDHRYITWCLYNYGPLVYMANYCMVKRICSDVIPIPFLIKEPTHDIKYLFHLSCILTNHVSISFRLREDVGSSRQTATCVVANCVL